MFMMTKSRLEGFTDGILVIIFTIMILEFKVPNSSNITAILKQFPYFISYSIGWLFLGEAWYNHLYIASKIHRVTHKLFVINALWLFTTSFLPLATAWIGQDLSARGPEIFYGLVFLVWTAAFLLLVFTAILDNQKLGRLQEAEDLRQMRIVRYLTNPFAIVSQGLAWLLILIFAPQFQLVIMVWQILFIAGRTNVDIDRQHSLNR